jgi:hypothetical protein
MKFVQHKPDGQDVEKLTNEQLALMNFEVFHEARKRGAVEPE